MYHPIDLSLYLVLDPTMTRRRSAYSILESAIRGGVRLVQIREKNCSEEEFLSLARSSAELLRKFGVPLIVNDRIDVALKVAADGIHLGQNDFSFTEARRIMGPEKIIGLSIHDPSQIKGNLKHEIDYLGVGSIFQTSTKKDANQIGLEGLKIIRSLTDLPIVGIGGIETSNAKSVLDAGANGIAVVAEICKAASPFQASSTLRGMVDLFLEENQK